MKTVATLILSSIFILSASSPALCGWYDNHRQELLNGEHRAFDRTMKEMDRNEERRELMREMREQEERDRRNRSLRSW